MVKIIQFQAMPNDEYYQGITIGLGDDGVMYVNNGQEWDVYHDLKFSAKAKFGSEERFSKIKENDSE